VSREYRVVWKREGCGLRSAIYQRPGMAERMQRFLLDPHGKCYHDGRGGDDPAYCMWADLGDWSAGDHHGTEPPPWHVEPRIEARQVGPWTPFTPEPK